MFINQSRSACKNDFKPSLLKTIFVICFHNDTCNMEFSAGEISTTLKVSKILNCATLFQVVSATKLNLSEQPSDQNIITRGWP